jgi:hypothetical protein
METKINSSFIVQILIINVILSIVCITVLTIKVYPSFSEIQDKKSELSEKYETFKRVSKEGLTFNEFVEEKNKDTNATEYLKDLIKVIPESFYNKNIKNTDSWDFLASIQSKISKLEKQKKDKLLEQRDQKIEDILPSYSDSLVSVSSQNNLTDFKFVSYVESLLYAFNLVSDNPIWIADVVPVKEFTDNASSKNISNSVDTNIFYIPLKLSVTGRKTDIIDFLHFVENVGNIRVEKWEEVTFYQDEEIKKVLPWENKNLYQNQIFDIEVMRMNSYLDSKLSPSNLSLIDLVKKEQANESMSIELQLRFYVKWLPDYLVKKSIKDTLDTYEVLSKKVDKKMRELSLKQFETSEEILLVNSVKTLNFDLQKLAPQIKEMRLALAKSEWIDALYRKSTNYALKFDSIDKTLDKIDKKLQVNTNKK